MADEQIKQSWFDQRIKQEEVDKYLENGEDFIPQQKIEEQLERAAAEKPDPQVVRDILAKSLSITDLTPEEVAMLIHVEDPQLLKEMQETALKVKTKVYDNRIVTFAPLYMGNYCVNNCSYCGFKTANKEMPRKVLSQEEIRKEVEVLAGKVGHKRLVVVYGEHPKNDVDFIVESVKTVYDVKVKTRNGIGNIRRVNINAPAFGIEDLKKLHDVGIGTYQVFQETYHRPTFERVHPKGTLKGDYRWRLYCMHRAMEAGIDDVGIGVLFGLADWKFEVMGLVYHSLELEKKAGIGPHTISFPRLEPSLNMDMDEFEATRVADETFLKIINIIRLAVPHAGLIITAREKADIRRKSINLGITQTDASSHIGVGGYEEMSDNQSEDKQQFMLGDMRSLEEVIKEFVDMGHITSFCTAGYRCGRTGKCIMDLLRDGTEGKFCKLNAVLTFQEWLDDFASEETRQAALPVMERELAEIKEKNPKIFPKFFEMYERTRNGERDLYL